MIQRIVADNFKCFEHIESYEQNALEKGIYLNGKYTNLGTGRDVLYTDAKEKKTK